MRNARCVATGDPPFFINSSTIKVRCSPNHIMVYNENGTYTAVRQRALHHCTRSPPEAMTLPNRSVLSAAPCSTVTWSTCCFAVQLKHWMFVDIDFFPWLVCYLVLLLDFIHRATDMWKLNHYFSEGGSASFFRQGKPNLLDPLDQAILNHCVYTTETLTSVCKVRQISSANYNSKLLQNLILLKRKFVTDGNMLTGSCSFVSNWLY